MGCFTGEVHGFNSHGRFKESSIKDLSPEEKYLVNIFGNIKIGKHLKQTVREAFLMAGDNLRTDFLWGGRKSNPEDWISALQEYASFDLDYVIPGHGGIMTKEEVVAIAEYTVELRDFMQNLLQDGVKESEIITRVNAEKPPKRTQIYIHESTLIKWYKFWK